MTRNNFLEELKNNLHYLFQENEVFSVTNKEGEYKQINVFIGKIPPRNLVESLFPYVFLKFGEGVDQAESSSLNVEIIVGTTSYYNGSDKEQRLLETQEAYKEMLHITENIRRYFLENRLILSGIEYDEDNDKYVYDNVEKVGYPVILPFKTDPIEFEELQDYNLTLIEFLTYVPTIRYSGG